MNRTYSTKNIELAATIQTITEIDPEISYEESGLAVFSFPRTSQEVIDAVLGYDMGAQAEARKLLANRNQLFKRIKGGAR